MKCKYCGFSQMEFYPVCPKCGQWTFSSPQLLPAPKKSSSSFPYYLLTGMLLIGILLFFLIPMEQAAATPTENRDTMPTGETALFQKECFILKNGVLSFDENKFIHNPILIIPAAIDKQPVEVIGAGCFENLSGVTTIILPSSVTAIEDSAFSGCTDLRGVCIPNATKTIGKYAFRDCSNLEAVYIPTALEYIGEDAFLNCYNLLFIFYNGLHSEWQHLYFQEINPFTWVICWDGEYRHYAKNP